MSTTPTERSDATQPTQRKHLLGLDQAAVRQWIIDRNEARFRGDQILEWIYRKHATSFDEMTNLSKGLRAGLAAAADIFTSTIVNESESTDGTRKLLLRWPDGHTTETVWIPEGRRHTACVSSQVGCPVGCRFCASGLDGVQRDLTPGEIVEQALRVSRLVHEHDDSARLSNIVLMGMGEPLANYDNVIAAIRSINASWGLDIGARKITLSTVGLPKQIRRLAHEGLQISLALSLHTPLQEQREDLIPWGRVPLDDLVDACQEYFDQTGREITLEYILLDEVNMTQKHAARLAAIVRRLRCNVNLLRYNPVPGVPYFRPSAETAYRFQAELRQRDVNAHIRTSRGKDIDAACGQLRRRVADEESKC